MSKIKGSTGRRYSEAEKKKIIRFDESQGRGGIIRAKEKFGVSNIALNRWLKGIGSDPGKRSKIKGLKGILGLVRKTEMNLAAIKARLAKLG